MSPAERDAAATGVRLDADRVVSAALEVANEHGLDGMTMRLVGAQLGADPTACYRYFASKDALIAAMADRLFASIAELPLRGTWRDRLNQQALAVREIYATHPTIVEVLANQPEESPSLVRVNEIVVGCLVEAGLTAEEIGLFHQAFVSYIIGNGYHEASWGSDPVGERAATRRSYAALDPNEFPNASSMAHGLFPDADAVFEFALALFYDAVEAMAQRRTANQEPSTTASTATT